MKESITMVSPSEIKLTGWNPRQDIEGESFEELKASIAEKGILDDIVVRPAGKGYELILGERRLKAAKELRLKQIRVKVREADEQEVRELMLIENLQREDLTPLEEAAGLQALIDMGADSKGLAKRVGKSDSWVQGRLALNSAPEGLKEMLMNGAITAQHITALLPFIGYPVYEENLAPRLKEELKWAKQRGDNVTYEKYDRILGSALANDYHAERVLCLTHFPYDISHLKKLFDDTACKKCAHVVLRKKERYCLNRTCYSVKLNQAKQAFEQAQAKKIEKLQKGEGVNAGKLQYGAYEYLDYATFDKRACKKCDKCKVDKTRSSTLDRGKGEQRLICLNPSCFRGKKAQVTQARNKAANEQKVLIRKCFKVHLEKRPAGMNAAELRFVLKQTADSYRYKSKLGSMSQKDLEGLLLGELLRRELRDYGTSPESLKSLRRQLPFKVDQKLAKKVELDQEKDEEE
jgi:ParB/RepB/Spo0J family partition protein